MTVVGAVFIKYEEGVQLQKDRAQLTTSSLWTGLLEESQDAGLKRTRFCFIRAWMEVL